MPKKVRELKSMLKKAGFVARSGKGSHTKWLHPLYPGRVTLSGKDSKAAKPYQEKEAAEAIRIVMQQSGEE
ncbi:MAG: type II toxin-antitoxin system HicA family toxin [Cyanobacteria bacterium P01_A01_bin.17]